MTGFVRFVDRLSLWVGHAFGWCILILTLAASEVAVGLALVLQIYKRYVSLDTDALATMKG